MDMSMLFHVAVHLSSQRDRQFPTRLKELEEIDLTANMVKVNTVSEQVSTDTPE